MTKPRTIVGEVTLNWPRGDGLLISSLFEALCLDAERRGYKLNSWQMSRVMDAGVLNEAIVAVFEAEP